MDGGVATNDSMCIIGGNCHRNHFCRDKTRLLSRQKYACRDKHNFVSLLLSRQNTSFFRDKSMLVATKLLSRQKTNITLSLQTYFCRDKRRVCFTCFVATNTFLWRQNFCNEKNYTSGSSRQWYITCVPITTC